MARIHYARVDEFWRKEEKYAYLDGQQHRGNVEWQELQPDGKHNWLTEGMRDEFDSYIPAGTREAKAVTSSTTTIFKNYGRGVATTRDAWAYNFDLQSLAKNVKRTVEAYQSQLSKWTYLATEKAKIDLFVNNDPSSISWSEGLKNCLRRRVGIEYDESHIRPSLYRPFAGRHLYFDPYLNERRYQ